MTEKQNDRLTEEKKHKKTKTWKDKNAELTREQKQRKKFRK